ncbi:TonB-dependent receptor [candidate division KSB1 bacterium]|nr:MAG: TonB-dependent receptor [candidate division KSB1 bacterium]
MDKVRILFLIFAMIFAGTSVYAGTTGKISGRVTDAKTGEPLAGVNVVLQGTYQGAATDLDGYYYILNVKPGKYTLEFQYVGYKPLKITNVEVQIDLTTIINAKMESATMTAEEVVVVAQRPVIQKDVAASQKSITANEVKKLPVTSIGQVVGLQAGVTSDFRIRGSSSNQALFLVDGIPLRDTRNNEPITSIPLSALEEVSVQSGGLGAEYSNVRSGVINVVTKEGSAKKYSGTITIKYHPPTPKHFGISPYDPNSLWLRPYTDDAVAWTGTKNGAWDEFTRRQYPDFDGWIAVSKRTLQDKDPTNDLSPEAAQRLFLWQHRKRGDITEPDYDIDAGFGGPVPFLSKKLGNLRFFVAFKKNQDEYLFKLTTPGLVTKSFLGRLTANITPSMKLTMMSFISHTKGTASSRSGGTGIFTSTWSVANAVDRVGFTAPWRIYTSIYFSEALRDAQVFSAKLTNAVSRSTYWEAKLISTTRKYKTGPGRYRDHTKKYRIFDDYYVDEAPEGYEPKAIFSVEGSLGMGGAVSVGRDTSTIHTYEASYDLTSQIDRHNQVKAGARFVLEDYDMGFGMVNYFLPEGNTWTTIKQNPMRGNAYIQDKLEFQGLVANLGLILDYYSLNGKWYDVSPYDRGFFSDSYTPDMEGKYKVKHVAPKVTLSPRLSISHPIGENAKLFFNYGHYREMPTSERLFRVQRNIHNQIDRIGDPAIPLTSTVSYELGYDHSLFNSVLVRLSGYYKDVKNEEFWVRYISFDGKVNYYKITSNAYEDIRGFEFDITKNRGKWFTGDFNYEYRVGTSGYFGLARYYENPADQREYEQRNPYQSKPRARPRIKSYVDLHTPINFGPKIVNHNPLSDWHFLFIANWTAGSWSTWNPNNVPGIKYNVQWKDYYNVDLRIAKTFKFEKFDLKFFADISNLFNLKHFSGVSFHDGFDYQFYMKSLHLPEKTTRNLGYGNIPGSDKPGDYRPTGVAYQPMEWVQDISTLDNPNPRVIYYDASQRQYFQADGNGGWDVVNGSRLKKILDNKAYIDMPNQTYFTFLNPRSIFVGLTLSYKF